MKAFEWPMEVLQERVIVSVQQITPKHRCTGHMGVIKWCSIEVGLLAPNNALLM